MNLSRIFSSIVLLSTSSLSFVFVGRHNTKATDSRVRLFGVQTISLETLENHEEDGTLMAASIVRWLDAEWIPQEVHVQIAESTKQTYICCREAGKDDLMDVMMQVSDDLDKDWMKYDKDAFVNAWDIGNYVADYLTKKSGNEGCACSSEIL